MSSPNEINFDAFYKAAPTEIPSRAHSTGQEEAILEEGNSHTASTHLSQRQIREIPKRVLGFFKDEECMRSIVDFFGIVTQSLTIANAHPKLVPGLNILSSPFYLYHAISSAKERIKLLKLAFKTSQVAKTIFWAGRSIDAIGTAVADIVKPFAGGAQITGLISFVPVGIVFSLVIPIILIVFGAIGGVWETWAMMRTTKAVKQFEEQSKALDGSMTALLSLLEFLQGTKEGMQYENKVAQAKAELEQKELETTYFTCDQRQRAIRLKIENLLTEHDLHQIRSARESLVSSSVLNATHQILESLAHAQKNDVPEPNLSFALIKEIHELYRELLNIEVTLSTLDHLESIYEKLIEDFQDQKLKDLWQNDHAALENFLNTLRTNLAEISAIKNQFLQQGQSIIELEKSELYRKMCIHALIILLSALTLTSGILYIADSRLQTLACALGIASSAIDILFIILNKKISEENFHNLHLNVTKLLKRMI